ncbi:MAG: endolytic transglycosylase MltG [Prevotella bivia]|nr:endolytic transglycosylase MltG [Prevotella bivia]
MGNSKKKRDSANSKFALLIIAAIVLFGGYIAFFSSMSKDGKAHYVMVDEDDTPDSILHKLKPEAKGYGFLVYKQLASVIGYGDHIRVGRYKIGNSGALMTFRHIRNGMQAPISLTIKSVRTLGDLADDVCKQMMFTRAEFMNKITDPETCKKYGYTPMTIIAMFVPNTYDFYWDTSLDKFLDKINAGSKKFWNFERTQKAKQMGFTPVEVITMASIVDEETDNVEEMPMVAGMYMNRYKKGMRLQADPTVKYATRNFTAHRIYEKWTREDSPYNTYMYKGLPIGPIRIPSVDAIDAVLNYVHHDYMYMCAKEDFSGTHNFAKTYEEHQVNADNYAKALDEKGIK